jgi:hypothetical protein
MSHDLDDVSTVLALRLRDLARALDRLDRLESGTGEWLAAQTDGDFSAAAYEMTLRALRVAADPTNFAILAFLSRHTTTPMAELEGAAGLGRLALAERVSDLVQVGLAARNIDTDQVQGTAAGAVLVGWINRISEDTANKLASVLRSAAK